MELFKLTTPKDDAWRVIEALGHEDLVQFLNMTENVEITKLLYQDRIKLCEETERRILFLLNTCREYHIKINKPADPESFSRNIAAIEAEKKKSHDLLFDAIETEVRDCERFVVSQRDTIDEIKRNIDKLDDYNQVISFISSMMNNLNGARPAQAASDAENPGGDLYIDSALQFIAGTVKHEEMERMKLMLFRITRGRALTHFRPYTQNNVEKVAYMVVFSAAGGNLDRVQKICDSFLGQRFEIPDMNTLEREKMEIQTKISKSQALYNTSVKQLKEYLFELNSSAEAAQGQNRQRDRQVVNVSTLETYKWFVAKEKAIYNALNMLKLHRQTFIGYMWIPSEKQGLVAAKLNQFESTEFSRWRPAEGTPGPVPPTSFKRNDVLDFHQQTVDTYKYATYGEINPAIFQIVTFPYLYAVMYGDWGHGMIYFAFGATLCLFEGKIRENPGLKGLLVARYFLLMMGFFAVFFGFLYNEFFAVPTNIFGTCFDVAAYDAGTTGGVINYKGSSTCVYPFGMDPSWALSSNYLTFTNNIKEKLSVIIAYFHLNFGIALKALNAIQAGNYKVLVFDVITGFFIFLGLIGYMIVLIYAKWWYPIHSYGPQDTSTDHPTLSTSPSIIVVVIGDVMGMVGFATPNPDNLQWFTD